MCILSPRCGDRGIFPVAVGILEGPFLCLRLGMEADGIRELAAFAGKIARPYYLIKRGGRHVSN